MHEWLKAYLNWWGSKTVEFSEMSILDLLFSIPIALVPLVILYWFIGGFKKSKKLNGAFPLYDMSGLKKADDITSNAIANKQNIQIVSPSFESNDKYPAINRYPHGRSIGYMNFGNETFYIQIIPTTKVEDHSEVVTIVPMIKWDDETITRIKTEMTQSVVEIYYLDKPKSIAEHVSFGFNQGFQQHIMQINLSGN